MASSSSSASTSLERNPLAPGASAGPVGTNAGNRFEIACRARRTVAEGDQCGYRGNLRDDGGDVLGLDPGRNGPVPLRPHGAVPPTVRLPVLGAADTMRRTR